MIGEDPYFSIWAVFAREGQLLLFWVLVKLYQRGEWDHFTHLRNSRTPTEFPSVTSISLILCQIVFFFLFYVFVIQGSLVLLLMFWMSLSASLKQNKTKNKTCFKLLAVCSCLFCFHCLWCLFLQIFQPVQRSLLLRAGVPVQAGNLCGSCCTFDDQLQICRMQIIF